ncbi:hypothetical protein A2U01_0116946, partial [Trifolium medium]|nr:hypothetical protein [Trifolium medium]
MSLRDVLDMKKLGGVEMSSKRSVQDRLTSFE